MASHSGSDSEEEKLAITGVLVDPESLSFTLRVKRDTTFLNVIYRLSNELSAQYNTLFDPQSPIELDEVDFFIASNPKTNDDHFQPVSSLSVPAPSEQTFTALFKMPQTHALRSFVNENKENRAQMTAELLIRDDELSRLKVLEPSKPSRNKKKKGSSVAHVSEIDGSPFQKALNDMRQELRQEFLGIIGEQADEIKQLKASNTETKATLDRHSSTLHALHRRVVLDEARDLLINRYDFAINDLRLGGPKTAAEKRKALRELVQAVRSKLNAEDKALLSDKALQMIFESGKNTVRQQGNDAAHNASKEDLSLAILGTGLTPSQLALLEKIYEFTHNDPPQL
ncbi:hypothetical protein EDB19DRAFT_1907647 [Suillus lakei]|nr:hypothetical protein EDB19DRAFT_1907647 [Suillus lakei]